MIGLHDLGRMALHMELQAGAVTSANLNEYGHMARLLKAIQRLAGVPFTLPENTRWESHLEALAVASEQLADFAGPRAPKHDPSYWYRIFKSFALFSDTEFTRFLQDAARDAILEFDPPTVVADSVLLEDGSFLLSEDNDRTLME